MTREELGPGESAFGGHGSGEPEQRQKRGLGGRLETAHKWDHLGQQVLEAGGVATGSPEGLGPEGGGGRGRRARHSSRGGRGWRGQHDGTQGPELWACQGPRAPSPRTQPGRMVPHEAGLGQELWTPQPGVLPWGVRAAVGCCTV